MFVPGGNGVWIAPSATREARSLELLAWSAKSVMMILAFPLVFLLMPFSIRKAKVKLSHIARALSYSLFFILILVVIETVLILQTMFSASPSLAGWITELAVWAAPIGLAIWWGAAIGRYMKIPFGMIHALLLVLLLHLSGLAAMWLFVPEVLVN